MLCSTLAGEHHKLKLSKQCCYADVICVLHCVPREEEDMLLLSKLKQTHALWLKTTLMLLCNRMVETN